MSIVWIAAPVALLLAVAAAALTARQLRREGAALASVASELTHLGRSGAVLRADAERLAARVTARQGAEPEPGAR